MTIKVVIDTKHDRYFGDLVEYRVGEYVTVMVHELQRDVDIDMRDIESIHFQQEDN
jgi:hypothetical protein